MATYRVGDWRLELARFAKGIGAVTLIGSCAISLTGIAPLIALSGNRALAQNITLDGTLGQPGTLTGPFYFIPQAAGQTVGNNLFHSFEKFNLDRGEVADFESAANIQNILSRVTGGSPSSINGLILTDSANVNLFLINPSGIQFGPNARLDVGGTTRGSFVATTVDALVWPNGSQFSATNPGGANSLLTIVGDPSGFIASQRMPQPITVSRSILKVYEGQSLLLLGGDVTLDQSFLFVDYFKGGRIELGGVAGAGTVGLSVNGNDLVLDFPNDVTRADLSITNGSLIDVSAEDGGNIAIHARNLNISGDSYLRGGIGSGLGFPGSQAGDIILNATETVRVDNSSVKSASSGVEGNGGNINITASSLYFSNAIINSGNTGRGNAGSLNINVRDDVEMSDTLISSTTADGNAGGINIGAGHNVFLTNSGLYSNFFGQGSAGNIIIHAGGNISMENHAVLSTGFTGQGNPGSIVIDAGGNFSMTSGARLSASTSGRGNAGSVNIRANGAVSLDSSQIFSTVQWIDDERLGIGRGGIISIDAESLSLTNDAQLQTLVVGSPNRLLEERSDAGDITIRVTNDVALASHSGISSAVEQGRVGDGGSIHITAGSLALSDGSQLTTDMSGQGNAGTITIGVDNQLVLTEQSAISTALNAGAAGRGGSIDIEAGSVELTDSAQINASTAGDGRAGDITVSSDNLRVERGAKIQTATASDGDAGNITLRKSEEIVLSGDRTGVFANTEPNSTGQGGSIWISTGRLQVLDGAQVTLSSQGLGNAGNLDASVGNLLLDNQGKIISESNSGDGGNITLQSQDLLLLRHNSLISTSAGTAQAGGNGGNITINAPFLVAVPKEDSDIRANAYTGRGGNINITTQGIYGLQFRPRPTPLSDITASSDFGVNGTVQINSAFDVTQGVTHLPIDLVDISNQIDQTCSPRGAQTRRENRFVITGRGGIPPSPNDTLQGESVITHWVTLDSQEENTLDAAPEVHPSSTTPKPLVEAQSWVYSPDGQVILVADTTRAIPSSSWQSSPSCRELQVSPK